MGGNTDHRGKRIFRSSQSGAKYIPHVVDLLDRIPDTLFDAATGFHIRVGETSGFFRITDGLRRNANQIGRFTDTPASRDFSGFGAVIIELCDSNRFCHFMPSQNALVQSIHQSHIEHPLIIALRHFIKSWILMQSIILYANHQ
ncbi:hypothetical protein D3C85_1451890 [compost metagenome]